MLLDLQTKTWKMYRYRHGRESNRNPVPSGFDLELIVDLVVDQSLPALVLRKMGKGKVRMLTLTLPKLQQLIKAVEDHRQTLLDGFPPVSVGYEKLLAEEFLEVDRLWMRLKTELEVLEADGRYGGNHD